VPAEFLTVQQALNLAAEHDTVLIANGSYFENLRFPPFNLTLASHYLMDGDTNHISQTIIDGSHYSDPDTASVIYINGGQDSTTLIYGLSITGGRGTLRWFEAYQTLLLMGGGCYINNSSPCIKSNHIYGDSAFSGGGIFVGSGLMPMIIENNKIYGNEADWWGGGVLILDIPDLRFIGNEVYANNAHNNTGIHAEFITQAIISDNYFHHNTGGSALAGVLGSIQSLLFTNNIVSDHTCEPTAGLGAGFCFLISNVNIQNNLFENNHGIGYGALGLTPYCTGIVEGNTFQDNSSLYGGNGLGLWFSHCIISNNSFINNSSELYGPALLLSSNAGAYINNNLFLNNRNEMNWGSAVSTLQCDSCIMRDNIIIGNSPPAVNVDTNTIYATEIDACWNWWGDASGPYHAILNPNGLGDTIGEMVLFDPWLSSPVWASPPFPSQPLSFKLYPSRPIPFNATTVVSFELRVASQVRLRVYDTAGRLVSTLVDGWREGGRHEVSFDGSGLASGVYLYRLGVSGSGTTPNIMTGKMVLLK
jgi:hypothetical protein